MVQAVAHFNCTGMGNGADIESAPPLTGERQRRQDQPRQYVPAAPFPEEEATSAIGE